MCSSTISKRPTLFRIIAGYGDVMYTTNVRTDCRRLHDTDIARIAYALIVVQLISS